MQYRQLGHDMPPSVAAGGTGAHQPAMPADGTVPQFPCPINKRITKSQPQPEATTQTSFGARRPKGD